MRDFFYQIMDDTPNDATLPPRTIYAVEVGHMLQEVKDELWGRDAFIDPTKYESYIIDLSTHVVFHVDISACQIALCPEYAMVELMQSYNLPVNYNERYRELCVAAHETMLKTNYANRDVMPVYVELSLLRIDKSTFYYCVEDLSESRIT